MNRALAKVFLAAAFASLGSLLGCDDDDVFDDIDHLQATLAPVPAVDASGSLELTDASGTLLDRLDVEFGLDEDDFDVFGVDAGDGFADENVLLTVRDGTQEVYLEDLPFDRDRRATQGDVLWDLQVNGGGVPELRRGQVATIEVNGILSVQGTIQRN